METSISLVQGTASRLALADESVDLIVTSPPYPMVEMWDEIFAAQDRRIPACLEKGDGRQAFQYMHGLLDEAWAQAHRVLKTGGIACINIGDATRTLDGDFQLYANHARILAACADLGFAALPDILWRKPTNAPNKFMGSGMLPVGAYVTYEHEYILVLRKGSRRRFETAREKERRRQSAFFWEERNRWFSDLWFDIKGTGQDLPDPAGRQRSAAFPFELAHRLVCMFSIQGDTVLDPFVGTGTTLAAALACGRNGVGIELDTELIPTIGRLLHATPDFARAYNRQRLLHHRRFAQERSRDKGPLKYANIHYGFPVVTAQERELLLPELKSLAEEGQDRFRVSYYAKPQADSIAALADPV
ncbi:MAG: site-specific DNA-methyltransferase [Candidatus Latescibacteria bacterium]|nr:site-specific DNA-methyltransferase [Candidatus Latescibacterota bacterium]